jgi:hypothetical protein
MPPRDPDDNEAAVLAAVAAYRHAARGLDGASPSDYAARERAYLAARARLSATEPVTVGGVAGGDRPGVRGTASLLTPVRSGARACAYKLLGAAIQKPMSA